MNVPTIKYSIAILAIGTFLNCAGRHPNPDSATSPTIHFSVHPQNVLPDTSQFVILSWDRSLFFFDSTYTAATLSEKELWDIEKIFQNAIASYNASLSNEDKSAWEIAHYAIWYKRQYICAMNRTGQKEVYINCFCSSEKYWKTSPVIVMDGGNCYFQLRINLGTKKYSISVNGIA